MSDISVIKDAGITNAIEIWTLDDSGKNMESASEFIGVTDTVATTHTSENNITEMLKRGYTPS